MNIALSSALIFFILIPGIVFRKFYYSAEFSQQYFKQSFFEVFLASFIPSVLLHVLWSWMITWFGYHVDLKIVLGLLTQSPVSEPIITNIQLKLLGCPNFASTRSPRFP
jgi:hypothetical protein